MEKIRMDTGNGNLPNWLGAESVYTRAQKVLHWLASNGHVTKGDFFTSRPAGIQKKGVPYTPRMTPSEEMTNLIDALNRGDEEKIKGLMLIYRNRYPDAFDN